MRNNKYVLPIIIALLVIFLPLAGYGIYYQIILKSESGNIDHIHKYNGYLYYYNGSKLIGMYKCTSDTCTDASFDNSEAVLKQSNTESTVSSLYFNTYAFISDGDKVVLYDLTKNGMIMSLKKIKNYNTLGSKVIAQADSGNYGILNISDGNVSPLVKFEYLYIGLNDMEDLDHIVVEDSEGYYLIDSNSAKLSKANPNEIYDYNDTYIIYKTSSGYAINDYDNTLFNYSYLLKCDFKDEFIIMVDNANNLSIANTELDNVVYTYYGVSNYEINGDKITLYDSNIKNINTVDLSRLK